MAKQIIDKNEWKEYFDRYSKKFLNDKQPEYASILSFSEEWGGQFGTQWFPVYGIAYDEKNDLLEIQLDEIEHLVSYPQEILVDFESDGWLNSLEVIERGGRRDVIEFR